MPLPKGTRLGPYEISSALGAGGMGEVYRAKDCRLKRDVALKVLPENFASDTQRMARFEREAQLLASLNHPNIAQIYGVEEWSASSAPSGESPKSGALVMELVEGMTLGEKIAQHGIPLEEATSLAKQIAEGLEYAHDKGVIHRDLKPANIKVTPDGQVKILDFGLAKALEDEIPADLSTSPTISVLASRAGVMLGTAGYMSPEQAKGKGADRRADVWSFGCVLFEMLTRKRAFDGETINDRLAAVIRADPDLSLLPANTPQRIRELLQRCLTKDLRQRLQSVGEARIVLENLLMHPAEQPLTQVNTTGFPRYWQRILGTMTLISTVAALTLAVLYWNRPPAKRRIVRSYLKAMPNSSLLLAGESSSGFALSPDGAKLAYVAQNADGKAMLWVRHLDSSQAQMLDGTEHASYPFWSADSQNLGFFSGGKLKRIAAGGGPALTVCDAPNARGGTWNSQGVIVFAPSIYGGLFQVPATGGNPTAVSTPDSNRGENTHRWPEFLPDGEHFIFLAGTPFAPKDAASGYLRVGSLHSSESKTLIQSHANGFYASGHLLFLRGNTLMAQPFDPKKLQLFGDPVPVAESVQEDVTVLKNMASASQDGTLVCVDSAVAGRQLSWVDRTGKKIDDVPGSDAYRSPRVSLNGKKIAFTLTSSGFDVWDFDMEQRVKTKLTFGSSAGQGNLDAIWSPDGRDIAYTNIDNGKYSIRRRAADGSGSEEVLLEGIVNLLRYVTDWSKDSKFIAYQEAQHGLFILPLTGDRKPYPLQPSHPNQSQATFSPDGRWIAYCSTDSEEQKVFVAPFAGSAGKWQVSSGGGCLPRWRKDGGELFYLSSDGKIMSVEIKTTEATFAVIAVKPLFEARLYRSAAGGFDVSPDGQRFVFAYDPGQPNATITLVENWDAELKKE